MALFEYFALDEKGKQIKGVIDADTLELAKDRLLKKKAFVTSIKSYTSKKVISLSRVEVLDFTRDLNQLLSASLPLYESLKAIEEKNQGSKHHQVYVDLCDRVKQGQRFSEALTSYPKSFNSIYISMCEAAEESGSLDVVFKELLRMMTKEDQLKKQLKSAMVYPMFLGVFCLIVVIGLFTFVIPSMKELLDGRQLHGFTQAILGISDWMSDYILVLLPTVALFVGLMIAYFRSEAGIRMWQSLLLKVPVVGRMKKESIMLKFCRTLSVLLSNGVPIVRGIEMSAKVMHHHAYEELMEEAKLKLVEGKKLSDELAKSSLIPKLVIQMMATAEATASLDTMLASIADIYEQDLDKSIQQFSSLIQPVMILLLGMIVGVVLLAVLLPLTDVSTFLN